MNTKMVTAPFLGLLFVIFLPLVGILTIPYIIFRLASKLFIKRA